MNMTISSGPGYLVVGLVARSSAQSAGGGPAGEALKDTCRSFVAVCPAASRAVTLNMPSAPTGSSHQAA
jgi:hypothetical protein